jgi:hypothetical protein
MLSGSMAVVWLDIRNPNELHLVSHTNPLAICRIKQLETIFFCSTKEAMQIAIHAGFGYKHNEIFEPTADFVYTIDEELEITKESVGFKTPAYSVTTGTYRQGYEDDPSTPRSIGYDEYDDGVAYAPMHVYKKANGETQTTEELVTEELNATSCEICGRPYDRLSPKEKGFGILYNYSDDTWACMGCSEDVVGESMMYENVSWEELIAEKVDMIEEELAQKEEDAEYDRLDAEELARQELEAEKESQAKIREKAEEIERIVQTKTVTELVGSSRLLSAPKEKKKKGKDDAIIVTPRTEKKEKHFFA